MQVFLFSRVFGVHKLFPCRVGAVSTHGIDPENMHVKNMKFQMVRWSMHVCAIQAFKFAVFTQVVLSHTSPGERLRADRLCSGGAAGC